MPKKSQQMLGRPATSAWARFSYGIALLSAAAFFQHPAFAKVLIPRHPEPPPAEHAPSHYFEIVRQKSPCPAHDCFVEYIMLADGTAVQKTFASDDYEADAKITVRQADDDSTAELFAGFDAFFASPKHKTKWTSNGGQVYYFNGSAPQTYSTVDTAAPAYAALFQKTEDAFAEAPEAEDFYVHGYYQIAGGEIEDYHVFSGGRVIFSTFSRQSDKMLATTMMDYSAKDFAHVQDLSKTALGATAIPYKKCAPETGIEYGLVEISSQGKYIKSHTCADTDDGVGALFTFLRSGPGAPKP